MKRVIFSIAIMIGIAVAATAQDNTVSNSTVTNKFGHAILPAAGDFALGIDAVPFLKYLGNMNNNSANIAAPSFDAYTGRIYGKYFLNEKTAVPHAHLSADHPIGSAPGGLVQARPACRRPCGTGTRIGRRPGLVRLRRRA